MRQMSNRLNYKQWNQRRKMMSSDKTFPWGKLVAPLLTIAYLVLRYYGIDLPGGLESLMPAVDMAAGGAATKVASKG